MPRVVPSQVVALMDKLFPWARDQQDRRDAVVDISRGSATPLATIVELTDQISSELINLDHDNYTRFVLGIASIKTTIKMWQANVPASLDFIRGFKSYLNPITLLRQSLAICPDESPAPSTVELTFISVQQLRDSVRNDISEANRANANGEWKAATVLAGAAIEALLLWSLQEHDKKVSGDIQTAVNSLQVRGVSNIDSGIDLEKWNLYQLIEVSKELNIIKPDTAIQANLAKNFRNLIHPGRATRLRQRCDRGTALSALAAIEHIVRDLT